MYLKEQKDLRLFDSASLKTTVYFISFLLLLLVGEQLYFYSVYLKNMSLIGEEFHPSGNILSMSLALSARHAQFQFAYIIGFAIILYIVLFFFGRIARDFTYRVVASEDESDQALEYRKLDLEKYQKEILVVAAIAIGIATIIFISKRVENGALGLGMIVAVTIVLLYDWYYQFKKARHFSGGYKMGMSLHSHFLHTMFNSIQLIGTTLIFYFAFNYCLPYVAELDNESYAQKVEEILSYKTELNQYEMIREDRKKGLTLFDDRVLTLSSMFYKFANTNIYRDELCESKVEVLNVRNVPSLYSNVVGSISMGVPHPVVGVYKEQWTKIYFDDKFGWVSKKYLSTYRYEREIFSSELIQILFKLLIIASINFILIPVLISITRMGFITTALITLFGTFFAEFSQMSLARFYPLMTSNSLSMIIVGFISSLVVTLVLTRPK